MQSGANRKYILISLGIVLVGLLVWYLLSPTNSGLNTDGMYFGEQAASTTPENSVVASGAKVYKNQTFDFSITIPKDAKTTSFQDGEGNTILIQNTKYQMQIYASTFDENIALTIDRIKKDIPDIKMGDPMEIKTGGVATVAFVSNDRGASYREIWFVYKGTLYQVLAPSGEDPTTATIMQSWQWN